MGVYCRSLTLPLSVTFDAVEREALLALQRHLREEQLCGSGGDAVAARRALS